MSDFDQRVAATAAIFLDVVRSEAVPITRDLRIGLAAAANLVGWTEGALRNAISAGTGPATFKLGAFGSRRTVKLADLALWVESRRVR